MTSVAADGQPSPETPVFELYSVRGTHRTHFQVSSQDCTSSTKIRTVSMPTDANFKVLLAINVQHIAINSASTESINGDSPKLLNRYNGRSVGAIDATS